VEITTIHFEGAHVILSCDDFDFALRVDAIIAADVSQLLDVLCHTLLEGVLIHDAGHTWVCEDVCIACHDPVLWEGPMLLRASCTMMTDSCFA
jgi:hypothetical protein